MIEQVSHFMYLGNYIGYDVDVRLGKPSSVEQCIKYLETRCAERQI